MFDKIEGWMLTAVVTISGLVGWGYRETQINKTQGKQIDSNTKAIKDLQDKSSQRGEVIARMDERQASMADDMKDIKSSLRELIKAK